MTTLAMFTARLQNIGRDTMLVTDVLDLLADCERLAAIPRGEPGPWYPPETSGWVEVPDTLMGMPAELKEVELVDVMFAAERASKRYTSGASQYACNWIWDWPANHRIRIVAYRKVVGAAAAGGAA